MTGDPKALGRSIATLGMAVFGPLALFSGIGVFGLLVAGPPVWLVLVFVVAVGVTAVCAFYYAAADAAERGEGR